MPLEANPGLSLRPATDSDANLLYRLYASTRADEMALVDWSELQKHEFLQMQFHAQTTYYNEQYPSASFDVIELAGDAIGRLYVEQREAEFRIIDIALLPHYRGRGIGRQYLQSVIDRAVANNCCVTIHVEHNNPAMGLYRRLGFEKIEDKGVYWFMRWPTAATPSTQENTAS
jgi:ribosomal protein S18 acetylase RimI-like enzyme